MGDADRLPMANVSRIIAQTLPKDASVSKEARVALSACATVFVHYITELCDPRPRPPSGFGERGRAWLARGRVCFSPQRDRTVRM